MTVRSFKKCGISVAADGFEIHIEGLETYIIYHHAEVPLVEDDDPFVMTSATSGRLYIP